MESVRDELLREGEAALEALHLGAARSCFEQVLEHSDDPDALTGLSKVAMLEREYEQAIELKERAFELYRAAGQFGAASASAHDGRIAEEWEIADVMTLLGQIGQLPEPASA